MDMFSERGAAVVCAHSNGFNSGNLAGMAEGLNVGRQQGYNQGYEYGYNAGYSEGWNAAVADGTQKINLANRAITFLKFKLDATVEALRVVAPMLPAEARETLAFALSIKVLEDDFDTSWAYQTFLEFEQRQQQQAA